MTTLGNSIRELRHAYGQSQQAFSNSLGIAIASIANYESGHRTPDCRGTLKLIHAARMKKRKDLVAVFKNNLLKDLSSEEIVSFKDL